MANKKILVFLSLFFLSDKSYAIDMNGVNADFTSIFNNVGTEQGKQNIVPTYQGTNIPETNINNANIENETFNNLQNNDAGSFVDNSFNTRLKYDVGKEINLISNAQNSIDNGRDIIGNNYSDCSKITEYKICYNRDRNISVETETYNKTCNIIPIVKCGDYYSELSDNLQISMSVGKGSYTYDNGIFKLSSATYSNIDITATITIGNLTGVNLFLNKSGYAHSPQLIINGQQASFNSEDITKYFRNGVNTMRIYEGKCGTSSHISNFDFRFSLKSIVCKKLIETTQESCDATSANNQCKLINTSCVANGETKTIEGLYLTKDCWNTKNLYQCVKTKEYAEDCSSMNLDECILYSRKYLDKDNKVEQFTYKCIRENPNPTTMCNPKIECLDGSCYDEPLTKDNAEEMLKTLSMMATLNESVKTIKAEDLTMLNGENLKCRKSTGVVAGFRDCCGDENWGNSLSGCSSDEERLKEKKENNSCIYIGNYCSEELDLGLTKICVEKGYSYCCFSNKFAKVIGNATRQQGLQTWGNAEHTNCTGIQIDRLQEIDFSKVDFSELYEDIRSNAEQNDFENRMRQSMERLQNDFE